MHRHAITWVILSAVIAMMFVQLPQIAARQDAVVNTYSALVEVDTLARRKYVDRFDEGRLVEGAIRGMMMQLDPYSGYIAPSELEAFERRTHGDFFGVGIEIGMVNDVPTVIAPIEGSPADKAGVLPGDIILAVDGADTKGRSVFDIEERLGGKPGTTVSLRMQRPGGDAPLERVIARGPVTLGTIRGFRRHEDGSWDYLLDDTRRIGYIRISSFHDNTARDFDLAWQELARHEPRGLILDLRFNPGGVMTQAVALVDRFVAEGLILSTVTRRRAVHEYWATGEGTIRDIPLAVLIHRHSASASEIVAGSLQDHGRALIVGERSFGKGSVQHLIRLHGLQAAVKLTVAHYRLPHGRIIHRTAGNVHSDAWGVQPDVEVLLGADEERAIQESRRILDLAPSARASAISNQTGQASVDAPEQIIVDDQLRAALRFVQGPTAQSTATNR